MGMVRQVQSVGGRIVLLSGVVTLAIGFGIWFSAKGPLFSSDRDASRGGGEAVDPTEPNRPHAPARPGRYPSLEHPSLGDAGVSFGAEPDFDPVGRRPTRGGGTRSLFDLLRLIPQGYSVLGILDIKGLRRYRWADSILSRRRLPKLRSYLDKLGFDPEHAHRVAFGVDLESRAGSASGKVDPRFLRRYDRPFCLIVSGDLQRRPLLRRFRQQAPLAAAMVMGRRVYRRKGDYALTFPVRGLVAWSYRRPMGPLLQLMLEDASRTVLTKEQKKLLAEGGLPTKKPPPLLALSWTRQPGRRVPWPFNRLGGNAIRGAVLVLRGKGKLLTAELRLLLSDAKTTSRVTTLLRYVRRIVGVHHRLRGTQLGPVVNAVPIRVKGHVIRITAEIRPWHVRALMGVLHKLIEP